ncbi:CBS domain-containing protein [Bradyrhizobium sp. 151]|nr:CBS domain-containing protein [Bradyrhizobium sp. 151]
MLEPLLIATSAAYALTVLLLKRSILSEKIVRRGKHSCATTTSPPFDLLRVNEVIVRDVDTLPATMTVGEAVSFFSDGERRHKSYPLIDAGGRVSGLVGRSDLLRRRAASADGRATCSTAPQTARSRSAIRTSPCRMSPIGWFWPTPGGCRSSSTRPGISSWLPARISCAFAPQRDRSRRGGPLSSAPAAASRHITRPSSTTRRRPDRAGRARFCAGPGSRAAPRTSRR